jgi:hypothetical protein
MDKLIHQLKKELLCSSSTKATITDNVITLDDRRRFAQFKINPSKEIPYPLYEQHFYIDGTDYHIVQIYPI